MNRVHSAVKLDLYTAKASLPTFAITVIAVIFIDAATKQPSVIMAIAMMFATALGSTIFQISEKNHLDKLYGVLSLKKLERVLARYLYALILGVGCAAITTAAALVLYRVLHIPMDALPFRAFRLRTIVLRWAYPTPFSPDFLFPGLTSLRWLRFLFCSFY